MTHPHEAPHLWIRPLAAELSRQLLDAPIEGAVSGPGWLSVRIGGKFLWFFVARGERLAWLADRPLPRRWLDLLGRHSRSPFTPHLREGRFAGASLLVDPDGSLDGLRLRIEPGHRQLQLRHYPRPGAIWLDTADGEALARSGRMEGSELHPEDPGSGDFDLAAHSARCEARLAAQLLDGTARRIRTQMETRLRKLQRLHWTLEGDLDRAREGLTLRGQADVLAAHLHEVVPGQTSIRLENFGGEPVEIELDPALPAHKNLDRIYHRAARAERSTGQIQGRMTTTLVELEEIRAGLEELATLPLDSIESLDRWLEFASGHGIDPAPRDTTASAQRRKSVAERLPYWTYTCGDWEIRVGRSAKDNDELTTRHAHLRDLWLHAAGVTGSHVVIRNAGKPVPGDIVEEAARIAAWFSKARTSSTVAVHRTERRYVRKPRKAPPGTVKLERAETIFVEPGIPKRWKKSGEAGD